MQTDSLFIFKGEVEKLSFYVKDLEKKYQDKVKVDENEVDLDKLTDLILEFVSNTAISQLDNLYEMYGSSIPSLKDRSKILTHFTLEYMNKCLTSLVLKNDKFIVDWFERFWAHCSHSPTCLLQILLQWTCYVHDSIDFDDLDCKSLEKFQKEVKLNIEYIINHVRDYVRKNLNHKCSGVKLEDIKPYDRIQKEDWSKQYFILIYYSSFIFSN